MMRIEKQVVNLFQENTFLVYGEGDGCILVDPGAYSAAERTDLTRLIEKTGRKPAAILLTHGHADHLFSVKAFQDAYGVPVYLHEADVRNLALSAETARFLGLAAPETGFHRENIRDGQVIRVAGFAFRVIHTPGHSPGSCCFLEQDERVLFTGDTLFAGTIGRTDLPGGEYDDEIRSIMDKLMPLDGDIRIYPGHGPASSIGRERASNPMLEPWGEKEDWQENALEAPDIRSI